MTEFHELWLYALGLLAVFVYSILYALGGREGIKHAKAIRRYLGGLFLALSLIGLSFLWHTFSWWSLGLLIGIPGTLSLGYGGGDQFDKELARRSLYGLVLGAQIFWLTPPLAALDLAFVQVILSMLASVYLGIRNPLHPPGEEMLIAALSVIVFPFVVGL